MENEKPYTRRKTVIFKTVLISEIVFQSFIATVAKDIVNELEKYRNLFSGKTLL